MKRRPYHTLLLVGLLVLLGGCGAPRRSAQQPIATPSSFATITSSAADTPDLPANLETARVLRVVDGDTVDVELNGTEERLRLIGLNTPETVDPRRPVECFGREASRRAHELLDGQTVLLQADPSQSERDRYDRLLRYIWLPDGRLFNHEMINQGFAYEYTYNDPYLYQAEFRQAEQQAREQQRGLWSPDTCNGERTSPDETATVQPTASREDCDPAYPDVCISSPPPDLDCGEIDERRFTVLPPDPHNFDSNADGVGCEGR